MPIIILTGYILVTDSDLTAIKKALPLHSQLTRAEKGCLVFEVSQDKDNANRFNVYEEFVDKKAFELHQQRVANSNWGLLTKNIERYYSIKE